MSITLSGSRLVLLATAALLAPACARRPAGPARTSGTETGDAPGAAGPSAAAPADSSAPRLVGLIAPHAGYTFSAAVAAWAWKPLQGAGMPASATSALEGPIFEPQVAGQFYPADAAELRSAVTAAMASAEAAPGITVNPVATVILLAPLHHHPRAGAAVLAEAGYRTPLGVVRVEADLRRRLVEVASGVVATDSSVFEGEHALEVELPFLQVVLPDASVVPVMVGADNSLETLEGLGRALAGILRDRPDVILAVSSDMSHFYSDDEARGFDERSLAALEALDLEQYDRIGPEQSGMCGYFPVRTALAALRELSGDTAQVRRLRYANSGDVTGERERVVGYGALALLGRRGPVPEVALAGGEETGMYTRDERQALMNIAKAAVRAAAEGLPYEPEAPESAALRRDGAAFVTLKENGELRGCIGHVIATVPLYRCVAEVARSAAVEDPRFQPVGEDELSLLTFEISVLTPPERVADPTTIVVGRDGLIMSRGGRRGLLLPQVPGEWGWDRDQFLDATCRKAGLPAGCWRDPETRVESFRAVVWNERLEDVMQ